MRKQTERLFLPPPFWLSDESVRRMTWAAKGLYVDALAYSFVNDGLPAEEEALAALLISPAELCAARAWRQRFAKRWSAVRPLFMLCPDGRLRPTKLVEQRQARLLRAQRKHEAAVALQNGRQ